MPNYNYHCNNCNFIFEQYYSYKEYDSKIKPKCLKCNKSSNVKKTIDVPTPVQFHGDDFTKSVQKVVDNEP